jgi:hypothetical protein
MCRNFPFLVFRAMAHLWVVLEEMVQISCHSRELALDHLFIPTFSWSSESRASQVPVWATDMAECVGPERTIFLNDDWTPFIRKIRNLLKLT